MSELIRLSVNEMREGLQKREFSAEELTRAHLDRIRKTNERLNSFITIAEDSAVEAAQAADKTIKAKGAEAPQLTGIPIAVKDMIITKGIETTCGSKILQGFVPPYDSTAVKKLKKSGAVLLGKTNMDEFAMGSSSEYSVFGPTKNPWDESRVPGGSSGGSAVSVAAGQAPLALGTDTGGSIRQPAGFCGVLGLKPTYGRVSRYGAVAFASSFDQIGPFARSVDDLAQLLTAISGKDNNDSTSMAIEIPDFAEEVRANSNGFLKGVKIGVVKEYSVPGMDEDVSANFSSSVDALTKLGAEVTEISLPHSEFALPVYYIIAPAEASSNLARYDGVRYGFRSAEESLQEMYSNTRAKGFGPEVKRRIMVGSYVLSAGYFEEFYHQAQKVRTLIIDDFKAAFANDCDMIATPTSPTTAFPIGEKTHSPLSMYLADIFTVPANVAGLPGISIPSGVDRNGLPMGLQLLGSPFEEAKLLKAAQAYLQEMPFDSGKMTH